MANFNIDVGADNAEIVSTLNYVLSNLGSAPFGLTINKVNGEILNVGTNTITGYLYQYIRIGWANNIQGLSHLYNCSYFSFNMTPQLRPTPTPTKTPP